MATDAPRRKGAARMADIPPAVLRQLNAGEIEAVTLVETLAVDFRALLKRAAPEVSPRALDPKAGIAARMREAGRLLFEAYGVAAFERFNQHPSDTVRGWSAFVLPLAAPNDLRAQLHAVRPLADDSHSGVREWAWLALRPGITAQLETALAELMAWTTEESPNLRRFATEATRPRGVWCSHIEVLKREPELGLPLLEPLRADSIKYVQDSVSNWLNDAAKSQPEWVEAVCARWSRESGCPATVRIVKRALRSL